MTELEPLDPELASLFAREDVPIPPAGAAARVLGRVVGSVATLEAIADAEGGAVVRTATGLGARAFGLAAATFVLGLAGGAGVAVALRPDAAAPVTYVDRPAPSIAPPAPIVVPSTIPSAAPPIVMLPSEPRRVAPTASSAASGSDTLGAERLLVEDARSRLARGDASAALERLDEHARRFPKARLAEEREALAIQALVNAGRPGEARARAESFRARWPSSVYLPAVDATIRSIP